ncbi:hypothetical protein CVT24_009063 [Panaeolus cyanescens]|uniref:Galactose oxidase n=1 Tax=Panaeolus cyanescens TaxID=181874 RepID=A0A409VE67_9AGAR|nr:hypothetical protein CVT24_009063 [Panaeolus cyanescens]
MQKALFVHGGKVDQSNQFSYTAAPNVNDVLYLPLSNSFPVASPPWELVNSATNQSTIQGPAISWHTLSAFNTTHALLFGGLPGPNSQTVTLDAPDSAALIDLSSPTNPQWQPQRSSWAGQPNRRIRHSTATAPSGNVYVFGGEKADGSQNGLAEYFLFNPRIPSFTAVSAPPDSPRDFYGHATIVLPDGRIILLGGYSQSAGALTPFSTLRVYDTKQPSPQWELVSTETTNFPAPRMAFASTILPGKRILIHGGSDSLLQNNMEDGWILDTNADPMSWSRVDALSQIGARRDHFVVAVGNQTIFGFGYLNNGPAPAALQIFDFSTNSYVDTFTPPSSSIPVTPTLPTVSLPTQTNPTGGDQPNTGDGDGKNPTKEKAKAVAAIVLGVVFGLVALVVIVGSVAYYRRRKRQEALAQRRRFFTLDGDEDDNESQHLDGTIPQVAMHDPVPTSSRFTNEHGILSSLGIAGALSMASKLKRTKTTYERRDMLADEDSQSLGHWYLYNARGGDGTGGSTWSLNSIFGGEGKKKSRDTSSASGYDMRDIRGQGSDPFADSAAAVGREEQTGFISGVPPGLPSGYHDPFADPTPDVDDGSINSKPSDDSHVPIYGTMGPTIRHISPVSALPPLRTGLPLTGYSGLPATTSTNGSQSSLTAVTPQTYTSRNSHSDNDLSRLNDSSLSHKTSNTSFDTSRSPPRSPVLTGSAIIGSTPSSHPIKRSDTWWARFARNNLLDRRSSDASRHHFDIRDPQPPPRLGAIEELSLRDTTTSPQHTPQGSSPDSTLSDSSGNRPSKIGSMYPQPPKSISSLRTANTEQIEYMAGKMDVVQRLKSTSSRHGTDSLGSTGGLSVESSSSGYDAYVNEYGQNSILFDSPIDDSTTPTSSYAPHLPPLPFALPRTTSPPPRGGASSPPVSSSGGVASRIQAFEKKMSADNGNEDGKRRTKVDYGLVPRASLFIANPDHRLSTSSS